MMALIIIIIAGRIVGQYRIFKKNNKGIIFGKIQQYFNQELDQEPGWFDAAFLLEFFSEKIGGYYYNLALQDAQAVLKNGLENITDAIYDLEKPIPLR